MGIFGYGARKWIARIRFIARLSKALVRSHRACWRRSRLRTKEVIDRGQSDPVLIFDDVTSEQIDVDFHGTAEDVVRRLAETTPVCAQIAAQVEPDTESPRRPGRPKLGVVAREVTLLPRHWEWLNGQPGGAVRRFAQAGGRGEAREREQGPCPAIKRGGLSIHVGHGGQPTRIRGGDESVIRQRPGALEEEICGWPEDIRTHVVRLIAAGGTPG